MELSTKIKVGNEEFCEIEVFCETAKTMSKAVYAAEGDLELLPLARVVARTKIKGLDGKLWNLKTVGRLSADDYVILLNAVAEFDENFTPEPVLILQ
jgi:hypothetical protein